MRTATTLLGLAGVVVAAFVVVTQLGGMDWQEFSSLANRPKPEQERLSPEPDVPADEPDGSSGVSTDLPPASTGGQSKAEMESVAVPEPESVAAPSSDLVTSTARSVRNVTGPGMTPAPALTGPLEREAVPKRPAALPRWKLFARVRVQQDGLLGAAGRTIRLAGIVSPSADRLCHPAGTAGATPTQSCDRLAMVALRKRIRAFGIECQVGTGDPGGTETAPCRIGKTDLSLWMLEQGWAEAAADAPQNYASAEKEARCARRGMWHAEPLPPDCLQN